MAVRVRLKIDLVDRIFETPALVNTGFETPKPQLILPLKAAEKLNLWPNLPSETKVEIYDTAGGPTRVYVIPDVAQTTIRTEDRESKRVLSDVVISHTEIEVLIGDKLAGELGIAIEDPGKGIWRFRDEPLGKGRSSEAFKYWI